MAMRPQNRCRNCNYTWFPRGKNLSNKCPNCGAGSVELVPVPASAGSCGCLGLLVVLVALYAVAKLPGCPSPPRSAPAPTTPDQPAQPQVRRVTPPKEPERPSPTSHTERGPVPERPDSIARRHIDKARRHASALEWSEALVELRQACDARPSREVERELDTLIAEYVDAWHFGEADPAVVDASSVPSSAPDAHDNAGSPAAQRPRTRSFTFVTLILTSGRKIEGELVREDRNELVVHGERGTLGISRQYVDSYETEQRTVELEPAPAPPAARPGSAQEEVAGPRLSDWKACLAVLTGRPWATDLRQIPATVIDEGVLRHVPYVSHRVANFELNVPGDPDAPAGVELGIVAQLVADLLLDEKDCVLVRRLDRTADVQKRAGMTFEITPPDAEDAFGGWWISVYDEQLLDKARAASHELEQITTRENASSADDHAEDPTAWAPHHFREARPARSSVAGGRARAGSSTPSAESSSAERTVYPRLLPERRHLCSVAGARRDEAWATMTNYWGGIHCLGGTHATAGILGDSCPACSCWCEREPLLRVREQEQLQHWSVRPLNRGESLRRSAQSSAVFSGGRQSVPRRPVEGGTRR